MEDAGQPDTTHYQPPGGAMADDGMTADKAATIAEEAIHAELKLLTEPVLELPAEDIRTVRELMLRVVERVGATMDLDEMIEFIAAYAEHLVITGIESPGDVMARAIAMGNRSLGGSEDR
jgi:hypothetical protein